MQTSCILCSANNHTVVKQVRGCYWTVRCNNCGLIYIDPQPDQREIRSLYNSQEYFRPKEPLHLRSKARRAQANFFAAWLDQIEKEMPRGKILDIGCAGGEFLERARKRGWEVIGVEISEYAASEGRKKFNLVVYTGTLEEAKLASESFDVVNVTEVIEHVSDPEGFLLEVRRVLKTSGLLTLSTPNFARLTGSRSAGGFPYHLYEFSPKTLSRLVSQTGFFDIRVLPNIWRGCLFGGRLRKVARYAYFGITNAAFLLTGGRLNWCQSIDLFASKSTGEVE